MRQLLLLAAVADEFCYAPLQFLRSEWFAQEREIVGVMAHEARAARHEKKARVVSPVPFQPRPKLQSGAIGQFKITDHHLKGPPSQDGVLGFRHRSCGDRRVGPSLKQLSQQFSHFRFVINQKDPGHSLRANLESGGLRGSTWRIVARVVGEKGFTH
jgi:hypothetical protein